MTRCFRFGAPHVYQRGRPVAKIFLASDLTGKHRSDVFVRPWLLTYTIAQDLQIRGVGNDYKARFLCRSVFGADCFRG